MWSKLITLTDLYTAANALLQTKYGVAEYHYYGQEVREGYKTPSFFVDIIPKICSNESINYKHKAFTIMITYFPKVTSEIDNLTKANEIIELFGYILPVKERKIPVTDTSYDFAGNNNDVLQVSIEIEYYEAVERPDTSKIASEVNIK